VTRQSPFRALGNTTRQDFATALSRTVTARRNEDLIAEAGAIYHVLAPLGLTRLGAAMAWTERSNDTNDQYWRPPYYPPSHHNLWAMKASDGGWARYASYEDAAREWAARLLSLNGPYAGATTLAQFIAIYAPSWDGNPTDYVDRIVAQINALPPLPETTTTPAPQPQPGYQMVAIQGTTRKIPLPLDCRFRVQLTPLGPNRSGRALNWTGVTQHETGNRGNGADAAMHATWQENGTQGHPDGKVGVHFYVDDTEIVQTIPVNEQGVHSGDYRNREHVAIELCVNADRTSERAERNSQWLCAGLLGWGMG
jgi:hypothetical protein